MRNERRRLPAGRRRYGDDGRQTTDDDSNNGRSRGRPRHTGNGNGGVRHLTERRLLHAEKDDAVGTEVGH